MRRRLRVNLKSRGREHNSTADMSSSATAHPRSVQKRSFFDFLKPRYHEAVFRLRNSLIALVTLVTLTHLLPLPTPYASAWKFYRDSFQSSWEKGVAVTGTNSHFPSSVRATFSFLQNCSSSVSFWPTSSRHPSRFALRQRPTHPSHHPQSPSRHHRRVRKGRST